jgi:hypothetical protein
LSNVIKLTYPFFFFEKKDLFQTGLMIPKERVFLHKKNKIQFKKEGGGTKGKIFWGVGKNRENRLSEIAIKNFQYGNGQIGK